MMLDQFPKTPSMGPYTIKIDNEKCAGCSFCADACPEGVIAVVSGKAKLVRENHCDSLGKCLPICPAGAITFEKPKAEKWDDEKANELSQWPVQIKLVQTDAPWFDNADLLLAADCAAYAYRYFHNDFMQGKITLIGCPKLDDTDYSVKLTEIIMNNNIASVTVARMEVPCCEGLEKAAKAALENSCKEIPFQAAAISIKGKKL